MSPLTPYNRPAPSAQILSLLAVLALGICSSQMLTSITAPFILLLIGVVTLFISFRAHHSLHLLKYAVAGIRFSMIICFFALGIITALLNRPISSPPSADSDGLLRCCVKSVNSTATNDRIIVEFLRPDNSFSGIKGIMYLEASDLTTGDIIKTDATLIPVNNSSEGAFSNYSDFLLQNGVLWNVKCRKHNIKKVGEITSPEIAADHIRTEIEILIENSGLSKQTASFLITVLLGDKSFLEQASRTTFSDAGVSHILALSGMHIAIIVMFLMWLFFPLNFTGKYKFRYYLTFIALWGYAFIAGFSPTIVRTTLMTSFSFLAMILQRKNSSFNALCLATLIILIITPSALFTVSLQLSFLCVASIILVARTLNPISQSDHPKLYSFCSLLITGLVTTFSTWMLTAFYFGTIPLLFLPANIIILPLLPIYISLAIIFISLSAVGLNIPILCIIIDKGYSMLVTALNFISGNGEAVLKITPSLTSVTLWLIGIAVLAIAVNGAKYKKQLYATAVSSLTAAILLI